MLAVLCSSPRPPLGVAIIGLTIAMLSWMLHLLPYIMFCGMITLSVWPSSHPPPPEVTYQPVYGLPNHVHVVYTRVGPKEAWSFNLDAELRILVFLLAIPVTSVVDNVLFYPARRFFLGTIECWFDMRYVHPAQMTGSWPDTWTPIFNALRSCEFVADFIDSVTGKSSGPSLAHTAETHRRGGSNSLAQSTEQRVPSRQRKRTSSPEPIVHSTLECTTNAPRTRKTFISRPRVSSQSPWKANGLGGISPVSKNLSRIVGTLFHHPPPRKPTIRRRTNLMAKAPSPRVAPHILDRLWSKNEHNVKPAYASMPYIGTAICNSVVPWHDGAQLLRSAWDHASNHLVAVAPELGQHITERSLPLSIDSRFFPGTCEALAIEQTQFEQQRYSRPPLTSPPLPELPVETLTQEFVSDWQGEQYFQPWSMQTPLHHRFPHRDQHITPPVYGQQELVPQPFRSDPSGLDSDLVTHVQARVQHGSRVSSAPERPGADQETRVSSSPAPLPPFSSLPVAPHKQFTFQLFNHAPIFQFSQDAPRLDHNPSSAPHARPATPPMARTTTAVFVPCSTSQGESSHSVPFDAPPEAMTVALPVLQQPFWGLGVTGTFTFEVSQMTPYFDFSHHVRPPSPIPHQPSASAEQASPATSETATPDAETSTTGAKMTVDSDDDDDDSGSDSDSSDSSDSDSDSDMDSDSDSDSSDDDSDSDSDSDSSEDEDDAMATESVCKNSTRASDAPSKAQDDVQRAPADKDSSAPTPTPTNDDETDSDSDGYFEHISTPAPPGAPNDDDDDSSDEDMSDHEEEYRQYWEMFYTPRHRRQPQVSVGSV
ncbi:hypothetical protein EI94DRAFT_1790866 [Lactarius quietus]|nr:hypothetical protein EI94DRAFT_1790866 [Lactarius quietus]